MEWDYPSLPYLKAAGDQVACHRGRMRDDPGGESAGTVRFDPDGREGSGF